MYGVTFNKGKTNYRMDDLKDKDQILPVVENLNQKTWESIVKRMNDIIVEKMNSGNLIISQLTEEHLRDWGVQIDDSYKEKIKRFNMFNRYMYFFNLRYPNTFFRC